MCLGGVTKAHPHIFVDARTGFILGSDQQLERIKISWRYDEFTTLVLFETLELDQDQDGQLNDADRVKILEGETNWPKGYKGDIYLEVLGQDYPLGRPKAAAVMLNANQIEVSFDLPLSQPIRIETAPYSCGFMIHFFTTPIPLCPRQTPPICLKIVRRRSYLLSQTPLRATRPGAHEQWT